MPFLACSFRGVKFYISGASVPGEGELKCIDWVKHMCAAGTAESAVIVGGDADLVLQGLALGQVQKVVCAHVSGTSTLCHARG